MSITGRMNVGDDGLTEKGIERPVGKGTLVNEARLKNRGGERRGTAPKVLIEEKKKISLLEPPRRGKRIIGVVASYAGR